MKWFEPEKKIRQAVVAGLTACGVEVTYYAKQFSPVDTTNLKRSINWRIVGNSVRIGTNVEYAIYQEFGTRKMKAHPYLRPGLDKVKANIQNIFMREFKRVLS